MKIEKTSLHRYFEHIPDYRIARNKKHALSDISILSILAVICGAESWNSIDQFLDLHIRIQKGKPMQNGFCERFNKTFREDVLNAYWFENIEQARTIAQDWMDGYNNYHPHASLGNCSPIEFKLKRSA